MTYEEAQQALDLIKQADDHASQQRIEGLEAVFDASDRQVAQLAALKSINTDDAVTGVIASLVAEAAGEEADPT